MSTLLVPFLGSQRQEFNIDENRHADFGVMERQHMRNDSYSSGELYDVSLVILCHERKTPNRSLPYEAYLAS